MSGENYTGETNVWAGGKERGREETEGTGMFRGERLVRRIEHGVSAQSSTADTGAWFTAPRRRRYRDSKAASA
jgi:hypothetical protein